MLDILAIVLLLILFAVAALYTAGCELLKGRRS